VSSVTQSRYPTAVPAPVASSSINPAPTEFGRSLVVSQGSVIPEPWASAPTYAIDEALLENPPQLELVISELHRLWSERAPFVAQLFVDPSTLREPQTTRLAPWELGGGFTFLIERLQFVVWRNSYDGRTDELIWWWARKAQNLGAELNTTTDTLVNGVEYWIDGGPRGTAPEGIDTIHVESIELGELLVEPMDVRDAAAAGLDKDQAAAVLAPLPSARIIAPAGSGKTRTMVARVGHLVNEQKVQRSLVTVLAYNKKAQLELEERLGSDGHGLHVRTFHSLAFSIVTRALGHPPAVLNEADVRSLISGLARTIPRPNVDPIAPFIEAATEVRLGLVAPAEVELSRDDVPDFRNVFDQLREHMQSKRALDFEEMVYRAIEILLRQPEQRSHWQRYCRHVLVDEFQDLTPAFLLLLRLVASPGLQVFSVGDDDQTIYGYIGADPAYLIDYSDLFPGAVLRSLQTNYRCPVPVVKAASHLLTHNSKRVDKEIAAGPDALDGPESLGVQLHSSSRIADAAANQIEDWIAGGSLPSQIAVLTRVNTALLPMVAALGLRDIQVAVNMPPFMGRTAVAASLAWLRLGLDPDRLHRADLMRAIRRPRIGLVREAERRLEGHRTLSITQLRSLGANLSGKKAASWDLFCDNIAMVSRKVVGTTATTMHAILHTLGLSDAAELLDKRRTAANSAHGDDLLALERLAALHDDPVTFETWLNTLSATPSNPEGVQLATIHKVKGAEWDNVLIFGVDRRAMPHRLSDDREEERRILHVGLTRGRREVRLFADETEPSPFLTELAQDRQETTSPPPPLRPPKGISVAEGDRVRMSGGYEAAISEIDEDGALAQIVGSAAAVRLHWGQHISLIDGRSGTLVRSSPNGPDPVNAELVTRLKEWRRATATQKGMPAYVILHDSSIMELASRRPTTERALLEITGIGPGKVESYGEDLLALLEL